MAILTDEEIADSWATWEESLTDSCTITPPSGSPVTVNCAAVQPTGQTKGDSGGGNQLGQPNDLTFAVSRGTAVKTGYTITWNARDFSVGNVVIPTTYDPGILVQCVEVTA